MSLLDRLLPDCFGLGYELLQPNSTIRARSLGHEPLHPAGYPFARLSFRKRVHESNGEHDTSCEPQHVDEPLRTGSHVCQNYTLAGLVGGFSSESGKGGSRVGERAKEEGEGQVRERKGRIGW
jgi:hypothetical protein